MKEWQVQDAKARFSEMLDATMKKGPQVVPRRGVAMAVLVPIAEWRRVQQAARPGLRAWLLGPGPRFENLVPERRRFRRRAPVEFKWPRIARENQNVRAIMARRSRSLRKPQRESKSKKT